MASNLKLLGSSEKLQGKKFKSAVFTTKETTIYLTPRS